METLIENSVATNTKCFACGGIVYALEKIKTTNHIYHSKCFRCRICKRQLTGATLNEEGDDIYCTNCYRKKQLGDCNGSAFKRAAVERAQSVYNPGHPDQPPPTIKVRAPSLRDYSRQPSLTMRNIERFLSYREPNIKDFTKLNGSSRRLVSLSDPSSHKAPLSAPAYLTKTRRYSSLATDASSPAYQFLPVFSPFPNTHSESTPKTPGIFFADIDNRQNVGNQRRFNQSSLDLTLAATPPTERKSSITIDLKKNNENKDKPKSIFFFPDTITTPTRRRSSSVSYFLSPRKSNK